MKIKWLSMGIAAAILSGCTSMMYGGGVAPVNNQNTYYGQKQRGQAPQQGAQNWQRATAQTQTAPMQNTAPVQNPVQNKVTTVQTVPASVQQQQEIARQKAEQERLAAENARRNASGTQNNSASPYATPNPQNQTASNNSADGWSVRPNNTPPTIRDEPKYQTNTPTAAPAANTTANNNAAAPVRPPERSDNSSATTAANNTAPPASKAAPAETPKSEKQVASAPAAPVSGGGSAVSTLLQKANSELGKGNLDGAVAYLEDAQRIDSKNANILYDIANIRYHQKRYREAEAAAAKAANAGGNSAVMKKSWSLIANSRKALGDNQGAIAAAEKAASF